MTTRKATAQDVANDLAKHEIQCTERWKTAFNRFDTIDNNILNVTLNLEQQAKETKNLFSKYEEKIFRYLGQKKRLKFTQTRIFPS